MYSRPKPGESEEDLLRLESEYLSKVINPKVKPSAVPSAKKEVETKVKSDNIVRDSCDIVNISDEIVIREKEVVTECFYPSKVRPLSAGTKGFPEPFTRDKMLKSSGGKSIFAQQLKAKREKNAGQVRITGQPQISKKHSFGESSRCSSVKSDHNSGVDQMMKEIHEENKRKLESFSNEEIIQQRNALISQLSPQLLEMFKKKRKSGRIDIEGSSNVQSIVEEKMDEEYSVEEPSKDITEKMAECPTTSKTMGKNEDAFSANQVFDGSKMGDALKLESADVSEMEEDMGTECPEDSLQAEIPEEIAEGLHHRRWLHMDVKEEEKLKWIGEIPKPQPIKPGSGHVARFDFEGVILPYDADMPVTKALHHHGSEPGRPGYTLDELLILSRSGVTQQRTLALTTLTAILKMAKEGYYDSCLDEPLLPILVERDILTLFRFSLDENSHLNLLPAATALSQLIVDGPDEVCLDLLLGLPRSHEQPCLAPKSAPKVTEETNDNLVARGDLIKGVLRMDILPRARYILEVLRPPPKAVISILELLTRIGRHSKDAAQSVATFPRLISTIVTEFIPSNWNRSVNITKPLDMQSVYGIPLAKAVKLMRILACSSPNFALTVVKKYEIMKSILAYVSIDPSETSLPQRESLALALESYYLWQVLLRYGITAEHYLDFSPILMRQLQFHQYVSLETEVSSNCFDHEYAAGLMGLLEASLNISRDGIILPGSSQQSVGAQNLGIILEPLLLCLRKWFTELTESNKLPEFSALKLVGSCLSFLSTAYSKLDSGLYGFASALHICVKCVVDEYLAKFMKSVNFRKLMERLWTHSSLRPTEWTRVVRDPAALPSAGGVRWRGEINPILRTTGPLPLLLPLANFLLVTASGKNSPSSQIFRDFLSNVNLLEYIGNVLESKEVNNDWFCRYEIHFIVSVVRLAAQKIKDEEIEDMKYHSIALAMVPLLSPDDEHLKTMLFTEVIFEPAFFGDALQIISGIESLELDDEHILWISPAGHSTEQPKMQLLEKALESLPFISTKLKEMLCLFDKDQLVFNEGDEIPSLLHRIGNSGQCKGALWSYKLLFRLCGPESEQSATEPTPPEKVKVADACLQWILLLEFLRPSATMSISPTLRFIYLVYIFLSGNDLFLEKSTQALLSTLLKKVLKSGHEALDFDEVFPELPPFKDLYVRLLAQFEAVSYGDALFSHVILLPLCQKHNINYRLLVWGERADVLRSCTTSVSQLMIPLRSFLEPPEKDPVLLDLYLRSLAVGLVREKRNPLPFTIAVHHIGMALKEQPNDSTDVPNDVCQSLRKKVERLSDKSIVALLLNYHPVDSAEAVACH